MGQICKILLFAIKINPLYCILSKTKGFIHLLSTFLDSVPQAKIYILKFICLTIPILAFFFLQPFKMMFEISFVFDI